MKVICLDFDGVVHQYITPWQGATVIPDDPVPGVFMFIMNCFEAGYDVVIHSSRSRHLLGPWAMRRWLKKHSGMLWHDIPGYPKAMCDIKFPRLKPSAFVTLDDRALLFSGTWPCLKSLETFKPWNKRT